MIDIVSDILLRASLIACLAGVAALVWKVVITWGCV
jgi:hypothetical protein